MSDRAGRLLEAFRRAEGLFRSEIQSAYTTPPRRTSLMLGSDGVLQKVCGLLADAMEEHYEYKREWYTIDALFVAGEELVYRNASPDQNGNRLWYPSRLEVVVEHENGEKLEEEMWKLMFWKAGLKVIIGYDYCENEYGEVLGRAGEARKGEWAQKKIDQLREMLKSVHGSEGDNAEYLLMLGNRAVWAEEAPVKWRWCRLDQEDCGLVPL